MKQFCCGDVVPGCTAVFRAEDEPGLFVQITAHANQEHGLAEVPPALLPQIRGSIQEVTPGL